ncbi:electron transport complex subunit RsxB [Klebsiella pneumoniae subsp. pneumoniae]|nr:electron transport complex subunit RsxB [Klebsiella pneumoniae subsp. pneumoniae]
MGFSGLVSCNERSLDSRDRHQPVRADFRLILGYASRRFAVQDDPVVEKLMSYCRRASVGSAGTLGVAPYAEAVGVQGEKINRCAPGGEGVMLKIAALLNVDPQPVDGDAQEAEPARMLAVIDEPNCIGCTKCIQACPVDAIVGATRAMHTVMSDLCTGCNLCVAPCPTQCISLVPVATTPETWKWDLHTIPVRNIPVEQHV